MEKYSSDALTVSDAEGNEHRFEILDRLSCDGDTEYLAIIPSYESEEDILSDNGEFDIVRLSEEDGGFVIEPIDDTAEFDRLRRLFEKRIEKILYGD